MADFRIKELIRQGEKLFSDKRQIDSLWEELALNFYPERADFTSMRHEGEEYAEHLSSSAPVWARRELGNLIATSLRPRSQKWFSIHVEDKDLDEDTEARQFLDLLAEIQWRAVYNPKSQFVRATKQCDHDYVTFGNGVIHKGLNVNGDGLLFRNYHLRDCAWAENYEGVVDVIYRKWEVTALQAKQMFGEKVSAQVEKMSRKEPFKKIMLWHICVPSIMYELSSRKSFPYSQLVVEKETNNVLSQTGSSYFPFTVPRWQTMAGSAYGVSMATMVLIPDGRTMQSVMRTIRAAGEKFVDPPLIAVQDAIRSDVALYPGGITTADIEYDERLGEVLRPLSQDRGGFPIGMDIAAQLKHDMTEGFFLDKIQLPPMNAKEMTAFEVQRRVAEHIRAASPIFEPIEQEYSAPLMDNVFNLLSENGAFPLHLTPDSLKGTEIKFTFQSPLADMADQSELANYQNVVNGVLVPILQIDPAQLENADLTKATRAAMRAGGWKADWFKEEDEVLKKKEEMEAKAAQMEQMMEAQAAGQVMEQGGKGLGELGNAARAGQAEEEA